MVVRILVRSTVVRSIQSIHLCWFDFGRWVQPSSVAAPTDLLSSPCFTACREAVRPRVLLPSFHNSMMRIGLSLAVVTIRTAKCIKAGLFRWYVGNHRRRCREDPIPRIFSTTR